MYGEKLAQVIQNVYPEINLQELNKDLPIAEILSLDSLEFVRLISEIEDCFCSSFVSADIYDPNLTFNRILEIMEKEFKDA